MSSEQSTGNEPALISQLSVVEGEPLADRAAGYSAIYEGLRQRLEGGDTSRS
jgi:hypothetical protein